ncbi:MAG: EMC3/TMCO1 family protein [Candidatus Micrarchaeota archaeon]
MSYFGLPDWSIIFLAAVLFSLATSFINRKTGVKQKTERIQKEMKDYQNEMNDAVKRDDRKKIEELKAREGQVMKNMQEMMFLPFKNMIFVIPLFFIVIELILRGFPGFLQELPIALHLTGTELMGLNIFHPSTYGPRGFFIISSIFSGMIIEGILGKLKKKTP